METNPASLIPILSSVIAVSSLILALISYYENQAKDFLEDKKKYADEAFEDAESANGKFTQEEDVWKHWDNIKKEAPFPGFLCIRNKTFWLVFAAVVACFLLLLVQTLLLVFDVPVEPQGLLTALDEQLTKGRGVLFWFFIVGIVVAGIGYAWLMKILWCLRDAMKKYSDHQEKMNEKIESFSTMCRVVQQTAAKAKRSSG